MGVVIVLAREIFNANHYPALIAIIVNSTLSLAIYLLLTWSELKQAVSIISLNKIPIPILSSKKNDHELDHPLASVSRKGSIK